MTTHPIYRHTGLVLARTTTDPGDLELPAGTLLAGEDIDAERGLAWLRRIHERPDVARPLRWAGPALVARIDQLLADSSPKARDVRRAVLATAGYLLRWRGRATPFGLFAGIAPTAITDTATLTIGPDHRARARADARWVSALVDALERHPRLRPSLRVVADNGVLIRGLNVVVPARIRDDAPGIGQPAHVELRHTAPIRAALDAAAQPLTLDALGADLRARFPRAAPEAVAALLAGLVDAGFLLTSLRPACTTADAIVHLTRELRAAGADTLPDLCGVLAELDAIGDHLRRHDASTAPSEAERHRDAATERMRALRAVSGPLLALDTAVDARITVPEAVLREAETAATTMLRVTANPHGARYWKEYQLAFRTRYGPGALVPVRALVADSGLGYPAGYLEAPRGRSAYTVSRRDHVIIELIQQAAAGDDEIELTEAVVRALTVGDPADVSAPPRVEIGFEIDAPSTADIRGGNFRLWVTAAPRPESSMTGRFAHLLDAADRNRLIHTFATDDPAVDVAQLAYVPRRRDNDNIARTPRLLPHLISVSEHPDPGDDSPERLDLDDLAVTVDATRMYLVRRSTGRILRPHVAHALEATLRTPPLARLLSEIATARAAVYGTFDFGAARDLPHLPRVRVGRTVLAPARWIVTTDDIAPPHTSRGDWDKAFDRWRHHHRVPSSILLCQGDLRLPLDTTQPIHLHLLRVRLRRAGRVELREAPGDPTGGWAGRPCEFLLPLRAHHRAPRARLIPIRTAPPPPASQPGAGEVVHARLFGNPARFPAVLTEHLPALIARLDDARWWFRRHRDTTRPDAEEHLSLHIRPTPGRVSDTIARLGEWADHLHSTGMLADLALVAHRHHAGRWGADQAAAEAVFAADTAAALAQITLTTGTPVPAQALAAASMTDIAATIDPDPAIGLRAALDHLDHATGALDRTLRDHTLALTAPHTHRQDDPIAATWAARAQTVTAWRSTHPEHRDVGPALVALLHDHHVRALGMDPDAEAVTNRLVRTAAMRRLALIPRATP